MSYKLYFTVLVCRCCNLPVAGVWGFQKKGSTFATALQMLDVRCCKIQHCSMVFVGFLSQGWLNHFGYITVEFLGMECEGGPFQSGPAGKVLAYIETVF